MNNENRYLTFALCKGRLANKTLELLEKIGITCEEVDGGIKIYPGEPKPAEIETYEDHRMAMAFSLAGLRAEGIVIKDPMCCRKTFETYFDVLDKIFPEE